ncbi:hypothetical protein P152DRAFT_94815 [Eremomyces bilateralis CBS 781.70]|uniref:Phenol 2-monooxygenase n=1 Tax=Eremomyces bilateralis CBS 781.70 TaxID=1392243 RepID=A0A6G1FXD5_9PEZI|nr:uncharacterized protein P152DRAFT_94815 [Eremomyces bilateralis CBS 781.70]KAF1810326.1 hypothetical protein P152DRAFT_94815 [Eremomyces bilateralis CBS 781.70]
MASADKYDIVIVGAGPVGLMLSTCLARWGYKIKHIDNRPEPTATGRADGIQPRSLDLLRNMGLKRAIMAHHPAKVYEVAFWDPAAGNQGIHRTGTWASCPKFIDARYPFTTLLHQGHIEQAFIGDMETNGTSVQRPWTITDFENDGHDPTYPVSVTIQHVDGEQKGKETVRAKYLFSGEGARSFIRERLGVKMDFGDPISNVWGVMDGVVRTNFPDIKMKCTIHSDAGSIMVIPREDNMVRLYIQIASSTDPDFNPRKTATEKEVQEKAKQILKPYYLEWDSVEWYSVYPIGQGIASKYTLDERVFLGGDCCHTHSPKAGQGMNTAFLDAANLAWKIHHVESDFSPRSILSTYEPERKSVAQNLLSFDAKYAKLFSTRPPTAGEIGSAHQASELEENDFVKTFKAGCEFTSGYGVAYGSNVFNWCPSHSAKSHLFLRHPEATTLRTGRILIPSTVTRVADANEVHLEQEIPLNGSYRIYIFGGKPYRDSSNAPSSSVRALQSLAQYLAHPKSFYQRFSFLPSHRVSHHEPHNVHSAFFSICTIFSLPRPRIAERRSTLLGAGNLFASYRDHIYADDVPDIRVPESLADGAVGAAHAKMGFGDDGGVVVVRPDGYVGCVVKLVEGSGTGEALEEYFKAFTTDGKAQLRPNL